MEEGELEESGRSKLRWNNNNNNNNNNNTIS